MKEQIFKVGDRVQIKEWDEMLSIGSVSYASGSIILDGNVFTEKMKYLCGKMATIWAIEETNVYLEDWSDTSGNMLSNTSGDIFWGIVIDMIKKVEGEAEKEWQPVRGERVLVRDFSTQYWTERIFLANIEGANYPFCCVSSGFEEEFIEYNNRDTNTKFSIERYEQMKRLETEEEEIDTKEFTLEEIAEKIGIPLAQLRINSDEKEKE